MFLKTVGRLSDGIRIGWRHGFDSGQSLDYVYRNRASGITPLGKLIDRFYLSAIGWRGIRIRKRNLEKLVRNAIARVRTESKPVRLLDIASGPGRYMLDILKSDGGADISALLRDHNEDGLAQGRALAAQMSLTNVTYAAGDAFDPDSLSTICPRPQVAVISGLFELFPDNALIQRSLQGLSSALAPGGYLVYTNQPWHPQIEMIARVLDNRDHQPWIMRRRTQAEMDELVRVAGFEKISMEIDRYGIFTVSLARRRNRSD
jgi:SAM-dependent methyltransferase